MASNSRVLLIIQMSVDELKMLQILEEQAAAREVWRNEDFYCFEFSHSLVISFHTC